MNLSHFVRTDWFYQTIISVLLRCAKAQLPNPLRVLSKTQPEAEVMGYWVLAIGYGVLAIGDWLWVIGDWLLAIGDWLLNMGGKAAYPCLYTLHPTPHVLPLHPTLYTKSASAPASNLSPYRLIPCQRQCFDADAIGRCSKRYKVARVKTSEEFEEH